MRIPKRRAQMQRLQDEEQQSRELTREAVERMKRTLKRLETVDRPKIVEDLSHAITLGDFSENAEYQDAKARLGRIDGRIFSLKQRIKNAIVIEAGASDAVTIGSTVTIRISGKEKTYQILGSQESDPSRGKISYLSPLGKALMNRKTGDVVSYTTPAGSATSVEIVNLV